MEWEEQEDLTIYEVGFPLKIEYNPAINQAMHELAQDYSRRFGVTIERHPDYKVLLMAFDTEHLAVRFQRKMARLGVYTHLFIFPVN